MEANLSGWMEDWMDGGKDGWMEQREREERRGLHSAGCGDQSRMDGWMDSNKDARMDGWMTRMAGWMAGERKASANTPCPNRMDGWMNRMDGWTDRMDGWIERMDGWMDRPLTPRRQTESQSLPNPAARDPRL